jgi:hypothetical protein
MTRFLSRMTDQTLRSVDLGRTEALRLGKATTRVRLVGPNGTDQSWSRGKLAGKQAIDLPVELPGFYQLSAAEGDGAMRVLERESFAANVDPRESDLRKPAAVTRRDPRGKSTLRAKQRVELWHGLGALLLLMVLGESYLTRRG